MKNSFSVVGRVVGDGEVRATPTGKKVLLFSVAESVYTKGEQQDPYYWDCELWEKQAEYWEPLIKKGQILNIKGSLKQSSFTPEGSSYKKTRIIVAPTELCAFASFVTPNMKESEEAEYAHV